MLRLYTLGRKFINILFCGEEGNNGNIMRKEGFFYSKKHKKYFRKDSIRLKGWDYAADGAYFVTMCVKGMAYRFGDVKDGKMYTNTCGRIVLHCWNDLPKHYTNCILDTFVVMPNHVHGVLWIANDKQNHAGTEPYTRNNSMDINNMYANLTHERVVETGLKPVSTGTHDTSKTRAAHSLSEIIRGFKTFSARKINVHQNMVGTPVWQSNYFDHIVRTKRALHNIRTYIQNNPTKWDRDRNNVW